MSNDIDDSKKIKLNKTSLIYNTAVLSLWNVMCKKAYTIKKTIENDIYKYEEIQNDEQDLRKKLEVLDDDFKYKLFKDTIENLKKNPDKNNKNNINDLVDRLKTKENERGELIEYYYKLLEGDISLFSTVNKYIKKYKDKIRKADITSLPADIIKALNDEKKRQMDNILQLEELRDQKTQLENINKRLGIPSGGNNFQPIVFENRENVELRAAATEAAKAESEAKKKLIQSLDAEKEIIKKIIATKINEINQEKEQINNNFKLLQNLQNINIYDYTINEILSSIENEDLQTKLSDIYSEKSNTEIYRAIIEKLEEYKKYIDKFKEQDKNELISLDNKNFYEKDIDFDTKIKGGSEAQTEADKNGGGESEDKITDSVLSNTNLNTVKDVNDKYNIKDNKKIYKQMKENYFEKICDKNNDFIEDIEKRKIHTKYKNKKNKNKDCIREDEKEDIKNLLAFIINFNSKNKLSIIKNIRANINLEPPILKPPKRENEDSIFLDNNDNPNENILKQLINEANTEIESYKNILETEKKKLESKESAQSLVTNKYEKYNQYNTYINQLNNFLKTLEGALSQKINSKNIQTIINRNKENIVKELEVIEDKIINIKDKVNMNALDIILIKKKIYLYNKINKDDTEFNETDVKDSYYRNYETEILNILMIIKNLNNHVFKFLQDPNSKIPFESAVDFIKLQIDFLVSKKNCFILPDEENLVAHFNFKNDVVYKNKIDSFYSQTNNFMGKHYVEFFKYLYSNLGPIYDKLDNTDKFGQNKLYNIINTLINNLPSNKISVSVAKNTLKKIEYKRNKTLQEIKKKLKQELDSNPDDSAKINELTSDPKLIDTIRESLFNLKKMLKLKEEIKDKNEVEIEDNTNLGDILKYLKELRNIDAEFIKAQTALNISKIHGDKEKKDLLKKIKKMKNKSNILNTEGRRMGNFTENTINALVDLIDNKDSNDTDRIRQLQSREYLNKEDLNEEEKKELKKLEFLQNINSNYNNSKKRRLIQLIKFLYEKKNEAEFLAIIGPPDTIEDEIKSQLEIESDAAAEPAAALAALEARSPKDDDEPKDNAESELEPEAEVEDTDEKLEDEIKSQPAVAPALPPMSAPPAVAPAVAPMSAPPSSVAPSSVAPSSVAPPAVAPPSSVAPPAVAPPSSVAPPAALAALEARSPKDDAKADAESEPKAEVEELDIKLEDLNKNLDDRLAKLNRQKKNKFKQGILRYFYSMLIEEKQNSMLIEEKQNSMLIQEQQKQQEQNNFYNKFVNFLKNFDPNEHKRKKKFFGDIQDIKDFLYDQKSENQDNPYKNITANIDELNEMIDDIDISEDEDFDESTDVGLKSLQKIIANLDDIEIDDESTDTLEEDYMSPEAENIYKKYILFKIYNSLLFNLYKLPETEKNLNFILGDLIEAMSTLDKYFKNTGSDTYFSISDILKDRNVYKIYRGNIGLLETLTETLKKKVREEEKWNLNETYMNIINNPDKFQELYSLDKSNFHSIVRLRTPLKDSLKGGAGAAKENDFTIELAQYTKPSYYKEYVPHIFYYGTLSKKDTKDKILIGPGDIYVDIESDLLDKRTDSLEQGDDFYKLFKLKINHITKNIESNKSVKMFTYGKSGSGKTFAIKNIVKEALGEAAVFDGISLYQFNTQFEKIKDNINIETFEYEIYKNQFVTENNLNSSRKHMCINFNIDGNNIYLVDLCGAERPFNIQKYVDKLDEKIMYHKIADKAHSDYFPTVPAAPTVPADYKLKQNYFTSKDINLSILPIDEEIKKNLEHFQKLCIDFAPKSKLKIPKRHWQEDFVKYILTSKKYKLGNDLTDLTDIEDLIKTILDEDKSLKDILREDKNLVEDAELKKFIEIMDNNNTSSEDKFIALIKSLSVDDSSQNDVAIIINKIEYLIFTYGSYIKIIPDNILCKQDNAGRFLSGKHLGNNEIDVKMKALKEQYFTPRIEKIDELLEQINLKIEKWYTIKKVAGEHNKIGELFREIYEQRLQETENINNSLDRFSLALTYEKTKELNIVPRLPQQSRNNSELFLEFLHHYYKNKDPPIIEDKNQKSSLLELDGVLSNTKIKKTLLFGVVDTRKQTKIPIHEKKALEEFHRRKIIWSIRKIIDNTNIGQAANGENREPLKKLLKLIDPSGYQLYEEYNRGQPPPKQDFYGNDLETIYLTSIHSNIVISNKKLNDEPFKFTKIKPLPSRSFFGGKYIRKIDKMDKINLELKNIKKLYKALK